MIIIVRSNEFHILSFEDVCELVFEVIAEESLFKERTFFSDDQTFHHLSLGVLVSIVKVRWEYIQSISTLIQIESKVQSYLWVLQVNHQSSPKSFRIKFIHRPGQQEIKGIIGM